MVQDHQIDTGIALLSGEGSVAGRRQLESFSEVTFDFREVVLLKACKGGNHQLLWKMRTYCYLLDDGCT